MTHSLSSSKRALQVLPVALALLIVALVASPAAQAHGKSSKHHGAKSGEWGKSHHKSGKSHSKHGYKHREHHAHKKGAGVTVSVVGGKTKLSIDEATGAALGSLGIAVEPIEPAYVRRGSFRFPITGGEVNAKTLAGQIRHSGGLAFVKGATRVELTDFFINVDAEPDLTAMIGGSRVSILSLDLSALERKDQGNKVLLSGIEASLTAGAAAALNAAFSTSAFQEGLLIGTAQVKAYVHKAAEKPCGDDDDDGHRDD